MNKTQRILLYLQKNNKGITSLEAINLCSETRLSDVIHRLKKYGYQIESIPEETIDMYGDSTTYARYRLRSMNNTQWICDACKTAFRSEDANYTEVKGTARVTCPCCGGYKLVWSYYKNESDS